ncbi:hypothetical protein ACJ41O_007967 [Fusarium nematophilum]
MGLLNRRAASSRNPFRDNTAALLVPTLLLATPIFLLLMHCAYRTFYLGHAPWGLNHDHDITVPSHDGRPSNGFLYVASYSGIVTTLNLSRTGWHDRLVALGHVSSTDGCAGSPSWLTLDHQSSVLYCTDEGLRDGKHSSLASFRTSEDGSLTLLGKVSTAVGSVSAVVYGKSGDGLAVAHYGGSSFSTWNVEDPADITSLQAQKYRLSGPGPDLSRQEAPHPHAAVVDPSGRFILVPDLGADLVRMYSIAEDGLELAELRPLKAAAGSGPRHLAFAVMGNKTFMYLVTELSNTVLGYEVNYGDESIAFEEVWNSGIHGKDKNVPLGAAASEIIVSPDSRFLIMSSRNESVLEIPNLDTDNTTRIVSDPLISFEINPMPGNLALQQEVPCGGRFPRQFAINRAGTLIAVALQTDSRVVVMERHAETGVLGEFVAYAEVDGQVTAVIFDE